MDVGGDIGATRVLSAQATAFDTLLARLALGGDGVPAYENLRLRLCTYFRLRFPVDAEALADEAIDRLARRLSEGAAIENVVGYALGIARLITLETTTRQRKHREAARDAALELDLIPPPEETDVTAQALTECLALIGPEAELFILDYYAAEPGAARIAHRQAMAVRAGTALNALRNRALRIRMGLEKCLRARLQLVSLEDDRSDEIGNSHTSNMTRTQASLPR